MQVYFDRVASVIYNSSNDALIIIMETKEIRLSIDSKLDHVPLLAAAMNKLCSLVPFSDTDAHAIELCVTEAVVNSIKHGYGGRSGYSVDVCFRQEPGQVVITIFDAGKPMDPKLLEEKKQSAIQFDPRDIDNIPESGRGLAIMQGYMDDVHYRDKDPGKCLILTKKIQ
jgi:anti-sigma regulatory factor (Ser/Thr protein kinase)